MNSKNVIFLILFFCVSIVAQSGVDIIPRPVSARQMPGTFEIKANTVICFNAKEQGLKEAADFFARSIREISGYQLPVNVESESFIRLELDKVSSVGNEGYLLNVKPEYIEIKANTKKGIVYGMQSLLQLLPPIRTNARLEVACMEVEDYPRFKWRGMHLDVSRHFFGPEVVKQYIDLMASYKLNTFHWHLVDDPGWRIEIKQYPELTDIGAWRVDYNHLPWDQRPQAKPGQEPTYGGYYTQEQIKEIIAYAAERNITIVPEIEMPGHVASAIAAFPELGCTKKPQLQLTGGDYSNLSSNYCAGDEAVFEFIENVLTEVIDLFPSEYIHIGGDEVNKDAWAKCKLCQERIRKEKLKDENGLQSYFIKRVGKFLKSKGRKMIGWDEILEGGLAPDATVMSWRGEAGGIEAARMKHDVVMTPGSPCYFDHYQAGPAGEPLAIGGFNTLKKVYDYEPVPSGLEDKFSKYVLGAQANVWTEYITTTEYLEYMVLPRMAALAEVVWTPAGRKDWRSFSSRIQREFKAYEQKGLRYCPGNFSVAIKPVSEDGKLFVELSTEILDAGIVYTLDGSEPTPESLSYEEPVEITSTTTIKAATVVNGKIRSLKSTSQHFVMHQAIGRQVNYENPVSPYYQADGPNSLTDGVRGTGQVGKFWHGFVGADLVATIDLGEEKNITGIALGCIQKYKDWILMPREVIFKTSLDGVAFDEVGAIANPVDRNNREDVMHDFKVSFDGRKVRYVRVVAKKDVCPPGHSGEGKPAWIFADEIMVYK